MGEIAPYTDRIAMEIYEAAARNGGPRRRYLGMSVIGGPCDRALWYGFRGFTPVPADGRVKLIFELGDCIETILVRRLRDAGYLVDGEQMEFAAHNGFFRGHCDGIIHGVTRRPHVLECKSANRKRFEAFRRAGIRATAPTYYCQVQCYMGYGRLERALVAVYCKDTSEVYTERIRFSAPDFEALHDRAYRIITANEAPERAFEDPETPECRWCDYRIHCRRPEEAVIVADDRVCGTCWYLFWKGLRKCCTHPDHPYVLQQWGVGCDDWSAYDAKHEREKAARKPRVPVDRVTEFRR